MMKRFLGIMVFFFFCVSACGKGTEEDISLRLEEAFIHYELGMDYYGIGEEDKALREWEEALKLDPNSEARHMVGHIYFKKGDYESAKKEWEQILLQDQSNFMALNNLGNLYKETKDFEKALEYYSRALTVNPEMAVAHHNVGNIYLDRGELKLAKEKFRKALALDPKMSIAMLQMGNLLVQEEKYDEAVIYFKKLADGEAREDQGLNPRVVGYSSLGKLYLERENYSESEKYLKKGLELQPSNPVLHYSLGNAYESLGKLDKAATEYKLVLQLHPGFPYAYNGLGNLYAEMGKNLDEAEKILLQGMEIDPDLKAHFLDSLGWVYYKQGKLNDALTRVKEAVALTTPDQTESLSNNYYHLGMIYEAKGENKLAKENLDKSIELYPEGESAKRAKKQIG